MCKKLIFWVACSMVLSLILPGTVKAADPDLAAYWKFDEGSGTTAYDSSGNGNDGVFVGDPQWVAGKFGGALEFDGDDYVNCGNGDSLQIRDEITIAFWFNVEAFQTTWEAFLAKGDNSYRASRGGGDGNATHMGISGTSTGGGNGWFNGTVIVIGGQWHHYAATYDGAEGRIYIDGVLDVTSPGTGQINESTYDFWIGSNSQNTGRLLHGLMDEVRLYSRALNEAEILGVMAGAGAEYPFASSPSPGDGAIHEDTWVTLSWRAGDFATSHDVYLAENFDDVNDATNDSDTFRGNQGATFFVAGFPGFAYPEGLVPGTTYYWRIDEINPDDPNSPWKGSVWSFSVPPKTAYNPDPVDGAESVGLNASLSWTPGFGAILHTVYLGEDFDTVANATMGIPSGTTSYNPGPLKAAKLYYWRVDEFDAVNTHKGDVWSFATEGAVGNPNPADGAVDITQTPTLTWTPALPAASHEIYFGDDEEAVRNATTASPEYKGTKPLGEDSYEPDKLAWNMTYYWRIDEVNDTNPDSPWTGKVWSFTTADFMIVEDFESYTDDDVAGEAIWQHWIDGYGVADNGAQVGYLIPPYAEQTIVQGGSQSMPLLYDNTAGVANSEAELTLSKARDWTEQGVDELSLWVHGLPGPGSFTEDPVGTYTMIGSGADIWNEADKFHYAYLTLTGAGSIVAKVESVANTNAWAKAGVMIRDTLEPGSKHASMVVTPGQGVSFQRRPQTDGGSNDTTTGGITAPYWVKIERSISGSFSASHSTDGVTWELQGTPESIQMGSTVHIGLAVTSHDAGLTCEAVISNVTTTGNVSGQWANQDIGIASNAAEPLYVAVSNASGAPAIVANDDPAAAQIDDWTEWRIPLQAIADQGINLGNVDKIAIGLGNKSGMASAGGSGTMYIDDIRLYRPAP